ncbi:MAG: iron-dependent peroxidase [bacterium]
MDYIWDVLINAKKQRMNLKDVNFSIANRFSPYMELSDSFINFKAVEELVEINPYYRFFDIFKNLFDVNYYDNLQLRHALMDIVVHFLGQLDLKRGMDRIEFYKLFFFREIKSGNFGEDVQTGIVSFSIDEKNILLSNLYKLYITGDHIFYMKNTIKDIFAGSIVYINKLDKNEILVYIKQADSLNNIRKMEVLEQLFLPINFNVKVYWRFHFGIIDVNETMKVNSISIY